MDGRNPRDRRSPEPSVRRDKSKRPGLLLHRAVLAEDEITTRDGIPVTTPARTQLDLPASSRDTSSSKPSTKPSANGWREPTSNDTRPRKGTATLRRLAPPTHTRSDLEAAFHTFLNDRRFPTPQTNSIIEGFEVDCVWAERRLVVELDSWEYHLREPGRLAAELAAFF